MYRDTSVRFRRTGTANNNSTRAPSATAPYVRLDVAAQLSGIVKKKLAGYVGCEHML